MPPSGTVKETPLSTRITWCRSPHAVDVEQRVQSPSLRSSCAQRSRRKRCAQAGRPCADRVDVVLLLRRRCGLDCGWCCRRSPQPWQPRRFRRRSWRIVSFFSVDVALRGRLDHRLMIWLSASRSGGEHPLGAVHCWMRERAPAWSRQWSGAASSPPPEAEPLNALGVQMQVLESVRTCSPGQPAGAIAQLRLAHSLRRRASRLIRPRVRRRPGSSTANCRR